MTTGVEFLRSVNLNEDSVHLNGRTVVIGGGNVAIDVARTALRTGSELVSMYCLESEAEMPAARDEVEEAKEEDIQIQCGWGPKEILTENGAVTGIVLKNVSLYLMKITDLLRSMMRMTVSPWNVKMYCSPSGRRSSGVIC